MSTLGINRTFADGDILYEADLDAIYGAIETLLNVTQLDADNFQSDSIDGATQITSNTVSTSVITSASMSETKFATSSVTTAKIADNAVTTAKILDSNVTTAKIADSGVTTAKIANSNVTTAKLATSSVTSVKIIEGAISSSKLDSTAASTASKLDNSQRVVYYSSTVSATYDNTTAASITRLPASVSMTSLNNIYAAGSSQYRGVLIQLQSEEGTAGSFTLEKASSGTTNIVGAVVSVYISGFGDVPYESVWMGAPGHNLSGNLMTIPLGAFTSMQGVTTPFFNGSTRTVECAIKILPYSKVTLTNVRLVATFL